MKNSLGGYMLFWHPTGPQLEYRDRMFYIADLNPELEIKWRVTPRELFGIGLKCIAAALRSMTS
ncbi:MAG: hypothetical protein KGL39_12230 [Patescibacteria group bacterium]|nr:hypothetical protein [Patescibacteria group bacterium]